MSSKQFSAGIFKATPESDYRLSFFCNMQWAYLAVTILVILHNWFVRNDMLAVSMGVFSQTLIIANIILARRGYLTIALLVSILLYYSRVAIIPLHVGSMYCGAILFMVCNHFVVEYAARAIWLRALNLLVFVISVICLLQVNASLPNDGYVGSSEHIFMEILYSMLGLIVIFCIHIFYTFSSLRYEERLQDSNYVLQQITNANPYLLFIQDLNEKIAFANKSMIEKFGGKLQDYQGNRLEKFIPNTALLAKVKQLTRAVSMTHYTAHVKEVNLMWKGKSHYFDITQQPIFNAKEELVNLLTVGIDITEYKQTLQELKQQRAMLKGVFNSSTNGMLVLDKLGHLIVFNTTSARTYRKFFGLELKKGLHYTHFTPTKNIEECEIALHHTLNGKLSSLETQHVHTKVHYMKHSFIPAKLEDGTIFGTIVIQRDITQRKEEEIHLLQLLERAQESDKVKSAFIANISHEIRTPMNGILGFSELMLSSDFTNDEKREYADIINKNCQHLMQIVDGLLDVAKLEQGENSVEVSSFDLHTLLGEVKQLFLPSAAQKGLLLRLVLSAENPCYIDSDAKKIRQILTNLLSNAIKFTSEGFVELSCMIEADKLVFRVKDTGVGIPREKQAAIFERFQQAQVGYERNYGGTGLGLAICKGFANLLGGDISVESIPNKGSVFTLVLDYKPSATHANDSEDNQVQYGLK